MRAPLGIGAVSCPSKALCVAGDQAGNILSSTNPNGGPTVWTSAAVSSNEPIGGVACVRRPRCASRADWQGTSSTSTDPTGGANAWTKTAVDPGGFLNAVSCPSVSFCVAGGNDAAGYGNSEILTTIRPGGGAGAWTKTTIDRGRTYYPVTLNALFCASVSLCVIGDNFGNILTSIDPTGGASAWRKASFEPVGTSLSTISCPSVSLCVAADGQGNIVTTTDSAGGASTWKYATLSERLYGCTAVRPRDQGARAVDTAAPGQGNSIGDVSLDGNSLSLSWTHDATQRHVELH